MSNVTQQGAQPLSLTHTRICSCTNACEYPKPSKGALQPRKGQKACEYAILPPSRALVGNAARFVHDATRLPERQVPGWFRELARLWIYIAVPSWNLIVVIPFQHLFESFSEAKRLPPENSSTSHNLSLDSYCTDGVADDSCHLRITGQFGEILSRHIWRGKSRGQREYSECLGTAVTSDLTVYTVGTREVPV